MDWTISNEALMRGTLTDQPGGAIGKPKRQALERGEDMVEPRRKPRGRCAGYYGGRQRPTATGKRIHRIALRAGDERNLSPARQRGVFRSVLRQRQRGGADRVRRHQLNAVHQERQHIQGAAVQKVLCERHRPDNLQARKQISRYAVCQRRRRDGAQAGRFDESRALLRGNAARQFEAGDVHHV